MAAAERIARGYLGSLLRLTLLAPDIMEVILHGQKPDGITPPALMAPFPRRRDAQCSKCTRPEVAFK